MDVSILRPSELSAAEISRWRRLQASDAALDNAFLSVGFATAVDHCRDDAWVATVSEGGESVAFLAFQRGHLGVGRAIGLGVSDAHAVICEPAFDVDALELIRSCGLGVWEFDHLVSHLDELASHISGVDRAPVMDVRGGYDSYMCQARRSEGRLVRSLRQKWRKLEREQGELEFVFDSEDTSSLETLMSWKSAQYDRTGSFDRFSRPWVRRLLRVLAGSKEPECRGTLSTLSAGGRLVAAHFGIRTPTRLSLWFPAYDTTFARYSPGLQLFLAMARGAPRNGIGILDLGRGDEAFKTSLASWYYPVARGLVQVSQLAGLVRRLRAGGGRRAADLVMSHPRLRQALPRTLSRVDRID